MKGRYVLAPQAAQDLAEIWRYIKKGSSSAMAERVESVIRSKIEFLAQHPMAGHWRRSLTSEQVKFFPVYSWLVVYRPDTNPLLRSCTSSDRARYASCGGNPPSGSNAGFAPGVAGSVDGGGSGSTISCGLGVV